MFKTKYKNYYFWLSFVTSIFGPCIIMNPKLRLFWNSSMASNIGYMVLLTIWLPTYHLIPELLQMSSHVTDFLNMNVFLPTMLAIIPVTGIVSWILDIYSRDEGYRITTFTGSFHNSLHFLLQFSLVLLHKLLVYLF